MAGGRPTKYNDAIVEKAQEYLDGDWRFNEYVEDVPFPTEVGLARYLGLARSTVALWAQKHAEFSDILEKILTIQQEILEAGGVMGKFNPTITRLILSRHGVIERRELEVTEKKAVEELSDDELARIASRD